MTTSTGSGPFRTASPPRPGGPRPTRSPRPTSRLTPDHLAHAWDVGVPNGVPVDLPVDLLRRALPLACRVRRGPATVGPALTPPADADEQTRWLVPRHGRLARDPAARPRAGGVARRAEYAR